jgi:hypothetical protein
MKKLILLTVLVWSGLAFAQPTSYTLPLETTGKVEGTPYFEINFVPAKITGWDATFMIRYNAYRDYIEMKLPDGSVRMLEPQIGKTITTTDNKTRYVYIPYNNEKGYLLLIAELDKVSLFARNRIYLQPESQASNGYQSYRPAVYKKTEVDFFWMINNGALVQLPKSKKDLLKQFPEKADQLEAYLKSNKTSFTKPDDLAKLTEFFNSLL